MFEKYLIFGKKGVLEKRLWAASQFLMENWNKPPIIRSNWREAIAEFPPLTRQAGMEAGLEFISKLRDYYEAWGLFGPNGDVISLTEVGQLKHLGKVFVVNFIANLDYPKPALAADLVPFIRSTDGKWFYVGIIRRDNGGRAHIGGFREVWMHKFYYAAETCIKESHEESGLRFELAEKDFIDDYRHKTTLNANAFIGTEGPQNIGTRLVYLGEYDTDKSEIIKDSSLLEKRVNQTTAFATFIVLLKEVVTASQLEKWLMPQQKEDAKEVFIHEIRNFLEMPRFIFDHHRAIYTQAAIKLKDFISVMEGL